MVQSKNEDYAALRGVLINPERVEFVSHMAQQGNDAQLMGVPI